MDWLTLPPTTDFGALARRWDDAAMVAKKLSHDMDNVFTGIVGFAELSLPLLTRQPQIEENVREIHTIGRRAFLLTGQMHLLSRASQATHQPTEILPVLRQELEAQRLALPAKVTLEVESLPNPGTVIGLDATSLRQIFRQLLLNAIESLLRGGNVIVKCHTTHEFLLPGPSLFGKLESSCLAQVIEIIDNGPGIPKAIRPSLISAPYQSTKPKHLGIGLGIVYQLLGQRGVFGLGTEIGLGTCAVLGLPIMNV